MVGKIADFHLIINRVRVLGSGPHTATQFFWEYSQVCMEGGGQGGVGGSI